ncbi:hypothetical protein [Oligella ureolytica]|uniref:hypothetical protein n=1 Tax=Oligella ureolytica TaxID=90244 RepID=UPI000E0F6F8C|nr:hypothetical protein [Oligella ureolytica]
MQKTSLTLADTALGLDQRFTIITRQKHLDFQTNGGVTDGFNDFIGTAQSIDLKENGSGVPTKTMNTGKMTLQKIRFF